MFALVCFFAGLASVLVFEVFCFLVGLASVLVFPVFGRLLLLLELEDPGSSAPTSVSSLDFLKRT